MILKGLFVILFIYLFVCFLKTIMSKCTEIDYAIACSNQQFIDDTTMAYLIRCGGGGGVENILLIQHRKKCSRG